MRNWGAYISGGLHVTLIGWALIAGFFASWEERPLDVAEVSILSGEEFAALTAPASAPRVVSDAPQVTQPEPDLPVAPPQPDTPPDVADAPDQETPADPDPAPQTDELAPLPEADVADEAPVIAAPPAETSGSVLIDPSLRPTPAPRVAPIAAPPPPPDAEVADDVRETATPTPNATPEEAAEPAQAPEEAATEIVTEAEQGADTSLAPLASIRPAARPNRPVRRADPAEQPTAPASDAINDALTEALASGGAAETAGTGTAPTGPPLTRGEKDALRVSVSRCWNVASLSSEAMGTTVVVGVSMQETGKPRTETIRMISYQGGSGSAALHTFESARRAIIRCGAAGFDLPVEKYSQWRDIEMTFNPEKMRIK